MLARSHIHRSIVFRVRLCARGRTVIHRIPLAKSPCINALQHGSVQTFPFWIRIREYLRWVYSLNVLVCAKCCLFLLIFLKPKHHFTGIFPQLNIGFCCAAHFGFKIVLRSAVFYTITIVSELKLDFGYRCSFPIGFVCLYCGERTFSFDK